MEEYSKEDLNKGKAEYLSLGGTLSNIYRKYKYLGSYITEYVNIERNIKNNYARP